MKISKAEQDAIRAVLEAGRDHGYGNMIAHLQTAWARELMENAGLSEKLARISAGGPGYPFGIQDDLLANGEWDVTGKRYRPAVPPGRK